MGHDRDKCGSCWAGTAHDGEPCLWCGGLGYFEHPANPQEVAPPPQEECPKNPCGECEYCSYGQI